MQMPILTYPNFSQFLQLHQQQQLQNQYSRVDTAGSETSADTSPSPSPPLSPPLSVTDKSLPSKSFTIDAILGLRDSTTARESLNFHSAFHPRLRVSDLSRLTGVLTREDISYSVSRHSDKQLNEGSKKCNGKSKRVRTIFTPEQLERLEAEFERQQYMVGPERLYLAHTLQLTEAQVKVWFQNRRIKWRKQHLELQQQRLAVLKQQQQRVEGEGEGEDSGDSEDSSSIALQSYSPQAKQASKFTNFCRDPPTSADSSFPPPSTFNAENSRSSRDLLSRTCDNE